MAKKMHDLVVGEIGRTLSSCGLGWLRNQESEAFDDSLVEFSCADYSVRFVRERGELSVDVASTQAPEDWQPLDRVLEACESKKRVAPVISLQRVGEILKTEHSRLSRALSACGFAETSVKIEKLASRAEKRLLDRLQGRR